MASEHASACLHERSALAVVGDGSACPPTDEGLAVRVAGDAGNRAHLPGVLDEARAQDWPDSRTRVSQSARWVVRRASFFSESPLIRAISESSGSWSSRSKFWKLSRAY